MLVGVGSSSLRMSRPVHGGYKRLEKKRSCTIIGYSTRDLERFKGEPRAQHCDLQCCMAGTTLSSRESRSSPHIAPHSTQLPKGPTRGRPSTEFIHLARTFNVRQTNLQCHESQMDSQEVEISAIHNAARHIYRKQGDR
jgi:hypothetical protein